MSLISYEIFNKNVWNVYFGEMVNNMFDRTFVIFKTNPKTGLTACCLCALGQNYIDFKTICVTSYYKTQLSMKFGPESGCNPTVCS